MKNLMFSVMVILIAACSSSATDLNKSISRYADAAQRKDMKGLYQLSALAQLDEKEIKASSPKFKVEKELEQLYQREKGYLEYKMQFFTQNTKWKILESKKIKVPLYNSKTSNGYIVYVETRYPDIKDAPMMEVNGDPFAKKPMKRSILIFTIDASSGLYYKVDHSMDEDEFWDTPVR